MAAETFILRPILCSLLRPGAQEPFLSFVALIFQIFDLI